MHLEVKASLIGQPHDFPEYEPHILGEEGVDEGIDHLGVPVPRVLVDDDLVLHEEMRNVVVQVHLL